MSDTNDLVGSFKYCEFQVISLQTDGQVHTGYYLKEGLEWEEDWTVCQLTNGADDVSDYMLSTTFSEPH